MHAGKVGTSRQLTAALHALVDAGKRGVTSPEGKRVYRYTLPWVGASDVVR